MLCRILKSGEEHRLPVFFICVQREMLADITGLHNLKSGEVHGLGEGWMTGRKQETALEGLAAPGQEIDAG